MTLCLLSQLGEGGLSAQRIVDQIGITQGGLLRHFPAKNSLWITVLTEIDHRAHWSWEDAIRKGNPAVVRLRKIQHSQLKLTEYYPAIPALLCSTVRLVAEEVVHPIRVRIMTAHRLNITEELSAAVQECDRHIRIYTLELVSLLVKIVQDCVLRWLPTGRENDLVAEGDQLIGLQLRLSSQGSGGDRS